MNDRKVAAFIYGKNGYRVEYLTVCQLDACCFQVSYDVEIGHKRVKEYLKLHYSVVRGKEFPGMMWAKEGCKGEMGPTQCMANYQWKPGTDKPEEQYKDFCDPPRYAALEQPMYQPPKPEIDSEFARMILDRQNMKDESKSTLYYGLNVRS